MRKTATTAAEDLAFSTMVDEVAARDKKARTLLEEIHKRLPSNLVGVVMVNADTEEWFNANDKDAGWAECRRRWGENIVHPPIWMISLTPQDIFPKGFHPLGNT
jgi:hypothetical protein